MPALTITRNYLDGNVLTQGNLDDQNDSIETFVNTTKLGSDNLQDGSVGSAQLATSAVIEDKIDDGAVTTNKIADGNVTTAKIADDAVTSLKILDDNVSTAKIADLAVTNTKLAIPAMLTSSSSNVYSTTSTSETTVTNLTVPFNTTGRPVWVQLTPDGSIGNESTVIGPSSGGSLYIYRDSTLLGRFGLAAAAVPASAYGAWDYSPPGTPSSPASVTYAVNVKSTTGGIVQCNYTELTALEH